MALLLKHDCEIPPLSKERSNSEEEIAYCVGVTKDSLLGRAVSRSDRVASDARNCRLRVGISDAVLNIKALDLVDSAGSSSGISKELSNNGQWLGGIDCLAWSIESSVTLAVRVEVASVRIACSTISWSRVCAAASICETHSLRNCVA